MELLRRVIALMFKEFLALLKDPRSRTVVIFPPIIQVVLFGYAATFDLTHIRYAYQDRDRSAESRELLSKIRLSPFFDLTEEVSSEQKIRDLIDSRSVTFVVRIDADFSRKLQAGQQPQMQVILDGRNSNTAGIVANYLSSIVTSYNAARIAEAGQVPHSVLISRVYYNQNLLSRWFFVPGIVGIIAMVVTIMVTSLSVAREREQGTFDQLLVTPLTPLEILVGKSLPGLIIGMFEASFIIFTAVFWFEVPLRGNVALLYLGLLFFIFAIVGIGLMISSLSVTMQQALLGSFLFLMPAVLLSGFATPIANMTETVKWVTIVNPLRYVLVLIRGVFLENAPDHLLLMQIWPLALIGAGCLTLAGIMFRNRIY